MTSFDVVYTAFLSKVLDDEWDNWSEDEISEDLFTLLEIAVMRFKFPRISLEYNQEGFVDNLTNDEVQILACYMKCEWLNRNILTWENVKPLYEERDFSQANLLDKFNNTLAAEQRNAAKLEAVYYRSIKKRPFDYGRLAQQGTSSFFQEPGGSAPPSGQISWGNIIDKPFEQISNGLIVINKSLQVDSADYVEQDNTKPVTSGAVYAEIGNINALLSTI